MVEYMYNIYKMELFEGAALFNVFCFFVPYVIMIRFTIMNMIYSMVYRGYELMRAK